MKSVILSVSILFASSIAVADAMPIWPILFAPTALTMETFEEISHSLQPKEKAQQKIESAQSDAQVFLQTIEHGGEPVVTRTLLEGLVGLTYLNPEVAELPKLEQINILALYSIE